MEGDWYLAAIHGDVPDWRVKVGVMIAAPEMLAALETGVNVIEQLIPEPSARGVADVVLAQMRAAIAKARGEGR